MVTVRRVIIFLNISRHPLLIWLHSCPHQYKTLNAVVTAIVVLTPAKNINKVFGVSSGVRHSTALSYPSIENLSNGCQGHPPFCLPPGTAQRLPDRIQKVFGRAAIYSANSCRWHKCEKRLKPENRKDPLTMTCMHWYYSHIVASISDMN